MDPLRIVVRVAAAYVFALVMVRLSGHRSIRDLNLPSFIVTLVIGDMFDNYFFDEVPFRAFAVAVGTLFAVHLAVSFQLMRSGAHAFRRGIQ